MQKNPNIHIKRKAKISAKKQKQCTSCGIKGIAVALPTYKQTQINDRVYSICICNCKRCDPWTVVALHPTSVPSPLFSSTTHTQMDINML